MLQVLVSRGQSVDPVYDKFLAYLNTGPCIGANPNGDQDAWDACKAVRDLMASAYDDVTWALAPVVTWRRGSITLEECRAQEKH